MTQDKNKTKAQLIDELAVLRQRDAEFEEVEVELRLQAEIAVNMSGGVYLTRARDLIIQYANPTFEEMFGYEPGELVGKPVSIVNAPTEMTPEETVGHIVGIMRKEGRWAGEIQNVRKDGTLFWCFANASMFDHPGIGEVIVSVHTDITERKLVEEKLCESELKYRSLFEQAGDYIIVLKLTEDGLIIADVNDAACRVHGYDREELIGMPIKILDRSLTEEQIDSLIDKMMTGGSLFFETAHARKDGTVFSVEVSSRLVDIASGPPLFVSIERDITERKEADRKRQSSQQRMRNLAARLQKVREEERTALARELHDQLGERLTGLKMDLDSVAQFLPATDARLSDRIGSAVHLVESSMELVHDICQRLRPPVLDILGLGAAIEWYVSDFGSKYDISCELRMEDHVPDLGQDGDTAVFRILQEALTNVVRHANASEVRVGLSKSDDSLVLEVADDGIGISQSKLDEVKSLGLLGMSERAEVFGGGVDIRQGTDGGTVVRVTMPLAPGQSGIGDLEN